MTTNVDTRETTPDPVPEVVRAGGLWADDLAPGQTFTSTLTRELTEEAIIAFARQFDPQVFHLESAGAAGTFFDGLVSSGWHTAAITMELLIDAFPVATGIVGAGGEVMWPSAGLPGDVLHLELTVDDVEWSRSRPGRASVLVTHRTVNQHGAVRQKTSARLIAWAKPAAKTT